MLIEFFSPALTVEALLAHIGRHRGVRHFERKFYGKCASLADDCWRQKIKVSMLLRGVVYVILRLAVLIQYWCVTDRRTERQTHDGG